MIRIDAIWLATEPMDMRAGTETALARVITVFGAAKPHCAYLLAAYRCVWLEAYPASAASGRRLSLLEYSGHFLGIVVQHMFTSMS